jgi:hypothetical protein
VRSVERHITFNLLVLTLHRQSATTSPLGWRWRGAEHLQRQQLDCLASCSADRHVRQRNPTTCGGRRSRSAGTANGRQLSVRRCLQLYVRRHKARFSRRERTCSADWSSPSWWWWWWDVGASPSLRSTAGLWHVLDRVSRLQRQHVLWCWGAKGGPCNWTWFKRRVRAKPLCRWAKSASRRAVDAQWWPVFRSVRDVRLKLANSQRTHACAAAMCSMRFTHVLEHTSKKTSSVSRQSLLCRVNHVCTPSQNLSGFDSRLKPNDMSTV